MIRRTIKRIRRSKLAGTILVVLLILSLPVLIPIGLIQHHLKKRRIRKVICSFTCISCGTKLGEKSMRLADERWSVIMADMQARYPNARVRVVRDLDAICPRCGCEYKYRDANGVLIPRHEPTNSSPAAPLS